MKVLVDTDVLMDALTERAPFDASAKRVIALCGEQRVEGYLAAHSITNLFYLLRKDFSLSERRLILLSLFDIFQMEQIDGAKLKSALLRNDFKDFEDCLQAECATAVRAEYIITRNVKDYVGSAVPCIEPEMFCALFDEDARFD